MVCTLRLNINYPEFRRYHHIPMSFKVLPTRTIGTNGNTNGTIGSSNGTIGKITNGTIWRTPNRAIIHFSSELVLHSIIGHAKLNLQNFKIQTTSINGLRNCRSLHGLMKKIIGALFSSVNNDIEWEASLIFGSPAIITI